MTHTSTSVPTFESLYEAYYTPIYKRVLRIVRNAADAEDVTQETFLKAFMGLPTFDPLRGSGSVVGWLYTIAIHTAINSTRRSHVRTSTCSLDALPFELADAAQPDPQTRYDEAIERDITALQHLQPLYREAVCLSGAGYSLDELAAHFEKSTRTIKGWLTEARASLGEKREECA